MYLWTAQGKVDKIEQFTNQTVAPGESCQVGLWSEWSSCECGENKTRTRTRQVIQPAGYNGTPCGILEEKENCIFKPCPVDCKIDDVWQTNNMCQNGEKTYTKKIIVEAAHGGKPCPPPEVMIKKEKCPVNCVVSDWYKTSDCTKSCGGGKETWERKVVVPAANGGKTCPPLSEQRDCNTQACPIDCKLGEWYKTSSCSKTCGGGKETWERSVTVPAANGGKPCQTPLKEDRECNTQPCPVDCEVSEWSSWTNCSKTCGTGQQTRTRTLTKQASFGGSNCPPLLETRDCNTQACPVPPTRVDCQVGPWSSWSSCTKSCGTGSQTRTRTITQPAANGGNSCPSTIETQQCNTQPCPVDCVVGPWNGWSSCSKSCGTGTQTRTRPIYQYAANGGKSCPSTYDAQFCNTQPCPVDCQVGPWSNWSSCSKSCGTGSQSRTRPIYQYAAHGGQSCPSTFESQLCNTHNCYEPCNSSACCAVVNDYLKRGWWYTTANFGECKGCPVVNYPTRPSGCSAPAPPPPVQTCNSSACCAVVKDYLRRGWWYTTANFGECKGCPVVNYPSKPAGC